MTTLFNDGVMEATIYPEGWIFVRWIQNMHGRLQKKLVKDLMQVEQYILINHLKGWFTSSETDHHEFQSFIKRVGATFMAKDPTYIYFKKWLLKPEDKYKGVSHVRLSA